jgi:hypothetical protein
MANAFLSLTTRADLQRLVDETLEESLTLDYKASAALSREGKAPDEMCKDVSAMANSAGGQIVYGIEEDKKAQKPSKIDEGVSDDKITREWIEQVLNSRVQPRMSGITTARIDMGDGKFGYVITILQSRTGPHQAPDRKYYKRFDLQSVPMYDYEIRDVMQRSTTPDLRVSFGFAGGKPARLEYLPEQELSKPITLLCTIQNLSSQPAFYVVNDVLMDVGLIILQSPDQEFEQISVTSTDPPLTLMRRQITCPPALPVFRESPPDTHAARILFRVPSTFAHGEGMAPLDAVVQTPGFTLSERWAMYFRQYSITLLPPDHPRVRTWR